MHGYWDDAPTDQPYEAWGVRSKKSRIDQVVTGSVVNLGILYQQKSNTIACIPYLNLVKNTALGNACDFQLLRKIE